MVEINSSGRLLLVLSQRWKQYQEGGDKELFIELITILNGLTEHFAQQLMPGLNKLCQSLETLALTKLGDHISHPLSPPDIAILNRQIDTLISATNSFPSQRKEQRTELPALSSNQNWLAERSVWVFANIDQHSHLHGLKHRLEFFGFKTEIIDWGNTDLPHNIPIAIIFINDNITPACFSHISSIRTKCPTSHLIYAGVKREMKSIVDLMQAGIDRTVSGIHDTHGVLDSILNLVQVNELIKSKVLIVEDSRVAVEVINRALLPQNIDTFAINDPANLIKALDDFHPDLVLMDMYMPGFNGVEATRALRQLPEYSSLPVVYLSGESDIGMQVEALRLGGDQFLTKPFNPLLLTAIVKTKIHRHREIQRSAQIDGLTGLLNHSATKLKLEEIVRHADDNEEFSLIMLDIDHFKSVNDLYGHPVGDEVIRGLAWLLKGRLRATDIIGRYGGEEFIVIMPGATLEEAQITIDCIREDFAELPHPHAAGELYSTFSAGIATFTSYKNTKHLIEAADNALLKSKRLGRNRTTMAV